MWVFESRWFSQGQNRQKNGSWGRAFRLNKVRWYLNRTHLWKHWYRIGNDRSMQRLLDDNYHAREDVSREVRCTLRSWKYNYKDSYWTPIWSLDVSHRHCFIAQRLASKLSYLRLVQKSIQPNSALWWNRTRNIWSTWRKNWLCSDFSRNRRHFNRNLKET